MSLMFFLWICLFIPNVPHSFQPIDVSHIQNFMVQRPFIKGCLRGDLQSRVLTFWVGVITPVLALYIVKINNDQYSWLGVPLISCFPRLIFTFILLSSCQLWFEETVISMLRVTRWDDNCWLRTRFFRDILRGQPLSHCWSWNTIKT